MILECLRVDFPKSVSDDCLHTESARMDGIEGRGLVLLRINRMGCQGSGVGRRVVRGRGQSGIPR